MLEGYKKTYIEVGELQRILRKTDYEEFYQLVQQMSADGLLSATKGGKETNGKYPPLARKYKIIRESITENYEDEIHRIFPFKFNNTYYLKHTKDYERDRAIVKALCQYHIRRDKPLELLMSINERSFDILGEEKWLVSTEGNRILRNLGLSENDLNIYRTPEPFIYYNRSENPIQKILIVENKDTWYSMRRLASEGLGPFDTLIYGEGRKILKSIEEIHLHENPWFTHSDSNFWYFGDLDDEGLRIYGELKEKFPVVRPWIKGYDYLLKEGFAHNRWRSGKAQRDIGAEAIEKLLPSLESGVSDRLALLFTINQYMPQEAMNYQVLRKLWTTDV